MVYTLYIHRKNGVYDMATFYDNAQEAETQARQMNMAAQSPVAIVRASYDTDSAPLYVRVTGAESRIETSTKTGFEKHTRFTMVGEVRR